MPRIALGSLRSLALLSLLLPLSAGAATRSPDGTPALDARVTTGRLVWDAAEALPAGGRLRVAGLRDELGQALTLELERAAVFAPDFRLWLDGVPTELDPSTLVILRGRVAEWPESHAVLSLRTASGEWSGALVRGEASWAVTRSGSGQDRPFADMALVTRLPAEQRDPWEATTDVRHGRPSLALEELIGAGTLRSSTAAATATKAGGRSARISFDSDHEYFSLFGGDVAAATAFAGELLAPISALYEQQIGVKLTVGEVFLWTTPADPWEALDPLFEVGQYWRQNRKHAQHPRAGVVFLSAKATPYRGVAWIEGLCAKDFVIPSGEYAGRTYGGYSVVRVRISITSTVLHTTAHEIGHLFASPHTHCYQPEVDQCYRDEEDCYNGPTSEPADDGSVMSYCNSTAFSLGEAGKYGTNSQRVPELISAFVAAVAGVRNNHPDYFAGCLAPDFALAASLEGGTVTLTWADILDGEKKWFVEQRKGRAKFKKVRTLGANTTTVAIGGLKPGTYSFRVRAKLKKGNSPYSAEVTIVVP